MSGCCPDCGNVLCVCNEVEKQRIRDAARNAVLKNILSSLDDVAAVNMAEPLNSDLERVIRAYADCRAKLAIAVEALEKIEQYDACADFVAREALEKIK